MVFNGIQLHLEDLEDKFQQFVRDVDNYADTQIGDTYLLVALTGNRFEYSEIRAQSK